MKKNYDNENDWTDKYTYEAEKSSRKAPKRDVNNPTLNKRKGKGFLRFLNPLALKLEMHRCGCDFSFWNYFKFLFVCYFALIVFLFILKLKLPYCILVVLVVTFFLPTVFLFGYWNMYEQKKFEEITEYMEQILYSFKRQPKILTALQDTLILFQNDENKVLHDAIQKAIDHIITGKTEGNIYEEAFAYIEEEYGCKRLYKVHSFLIKVENAGGECGDSIDLLLIDRNLWIDRIYELIASKQKVRINVSIAIGLSFLIIGMAIYMIPSSFGITDNTVSQVVTTAIVLLNFLIWFGVQKMLAHSLLQADSDTPFKEVKRSYDLVVHGDKKKLVMKYRIVGFMFAAAAVVLYLSTKNLMFGLMVGVMALIMMTQGDRKWKACRKRVIKEIQKSFPEWLLSLALQLQTDNVHNAIDKTIDDAPEIMKEELYKLQREIATDPTALYPYTNFYHDFYISDITSAMKMLYSMAEFGASDAQQQIRFLVERNAKIMDKAESLRMEDELAGISFAMMLPMITGAIKLIVDLALVMFYILTQMSVAG